MCAIIDAAHRLGLKVHVHSSTLRHSKEALQAGVDALAQSIADAPVDCEFIALMKRNGAAYTTTHSQYRSFAGTADWISRLQALDNWRVIPDEARQRIGGPEGGLAV